MGRSRDINKVLPRPTKTLPPLGWHKDDPPNASSGSTFQSRQDILSPYKVPNRMSISSLIESVSTGACEPRDITAALPRPRKSLPSLGWDKYDPVAATHAYSTFLARPYLGREHGSSQEREKLAQSRDGVSAQSGSTSQTKQDILSEVPNRITISSLIESVSTGACEPRDCILSPEVKLLKCPTSGCPSAPFRTEYELR
jgi:hypothetical protein